MDEYSGKRAIDGMVIPRKGVSHVFRDTANAKDRNGQVCSRLTCSSRVNTSKGAQIGSSEKGKSLKPSIQSSSAGKEAVGSSSRTFPKTSSPGKPLIKPRKKASSQLETDSSETSSVLDESEVSQLAPSPVKSQTGLQAEMEKTVSGNVIMEVGSSSVVSNSRSRRNFHPKSGISGQEIKNTGPVMRAGTSRYGLRNLKCNSISDVLPAGCSPSDSTLNRRKDMIKKRNCEGEGSSSARGKKISGSSLEGRNSGSRNGISISDSRISRNTPPHRDRSDSNMEPVRTRKSISGHARGRLSSQGNANPVSPNRSPVMIPSLSHSGGRNASGVSHRTSVDSSLSCPSSHSRPGTSSEELYGVMPGSPSEYGLTHSIMNLDSFRRRYNVDSIAEVLLALERIEQDVELTHEQIRLLESNLFLTGLNFYDPHRDMRLDIDNMSYEQLLALEERMGSVSTALTEEALSECLKKSFFQSSPSENAVNSCKEAKDDTKCSICQEEYTVADELGSLHCEHMYHVVCIQQWLRMKNWCPICKASVVPSNPSTSQ
ncbi:probable E3 ubiquitin-protein ligase HIP1 isoform X1 [Vigna umbellata]|uniref:probable E3 ubiquitin-protein ligase HIP1 isoform X1 n=1 Tax=Vigna umbellata TaxID=87088 RepID=UPI001F5E4FCE|nr:probable E3 ubiquitin-protein ligase HIP1 isoform X1 [Vigna umbellata]XP_047164301.1 probable E3 ubiquitin-protein ligase HIP1 isoform X1 [Vigna umbellata]